MEHRMPGTPHLIRIHVQNRGFRLLQRPSQALCSFGVVKISVYPQYGLVSQQTTGPQALAQFLRGGWLSFRALRPHDDRARMPNDMSLLETITESAIRADTPIMTLLRQARVLAYRLENNQFKRWVHHELNGYETNDSLPTYRIIHAESRGYFSGPFGSGMNNVPLPMSSVPQKWRDALAHMYLLQPAGVYESLTTGATEESRLVRESWPADIVVALQHKFVDGYGLMDAWKVASVGQMANVVDSVRNRILELAITLREEVDPTTPEEDIRASLPIGTVGRAVDTIILAQHVGQLNVAGRDVVQPTSIVSVGDIEGLKELARGLGASSADVERLEQAVENDRGQSGVDGPSLGKQVWAWWKDMVKKAADGAMRTGSHEVGAALARALLDFAGL